MITMNEVKESRKIVACFGRSWSCSADICPPSMPGDIGSGDRSGVMKALKLKLLLKIHFV